MPKKMLNNSTEFVSNETVNIIKLFFNKYWLWLKRKTQSVVNIRLLHHLM